MSEQRSRKMGANREGRSVFSDFDGIPSGIRWKSIFGGLADSSSGRYGASGVRWDVE